MPSHRGRGGIPQFHTWCFLFRGWRGSRVQEISIQEVQYDNCNSIILEVSYINGLVGGGGEVEVGGGEVEMCLCVCVCFVSQLVIFLISQLAATEGSYSSRLRS
jgi:hypothetical protein